MPFYRMPSVLCVLICTFLPPGCNSQQPGDNGPGLSDRERLLLDRIAKLEQRVATLEAKQAPVSEAAASNGQAASAPPPSVAPQEPQASTLPSRPASGSSASDIARRTTINFLFDGYYAYNFNNPIGRANLLRAYDVSSNALSLNQASLILENAANPSEGKRFGLRLDLQYGQATETLQGNSANELRPEIYRNIFQAYGTYVFPVGKGLTVDFGKFASSLGMEGNYTKDQMNYSRSYWFAFLPFYHMGLRASYQVNDTTALHYWLVNGTQQTEPFNGFKDQFFGATIQPHKGITWNVNYYLGQEHPDVTYFPNGGAPLGAPTQQGIPFEPIVGAPNGKLHIFDTYVTWQSTAKLTFAAEADYVIQRLWSYSTPSHTNGGAGYIQYQLTPRLSFAGRAEYLSDRGGMFSGLTQAMKETTFTARYNVADNLVMFGEWRRDFSNRPFFYTDTLGILKKSQNTPTVGLVWWFGGKEGAW